MPDDLIAEGSGARRHRRGAVAVTFATALGLALAGGHAWRQHRLELRHGDERVCRALQELDGRTYRPEVQSAIRSAGHGVSDHLGALARHADTSTWPGHMGLASEDYDYIIMTCGGLAIPVPNVD